MTRIEDFGYAVQKMLHSSDSYADFRPQFIRLIKNRQPGGITHTQEQYFIDYYSDIHIVYRDSKGRFTKGKTSKRYLIERDKRTGRIAKLRRMD